MKKDWDEFDTYQAIRELELKYQHLIEQFAVLKFKYYIELEQLKEDVEKLSTRQTEE